MFDSGYQAFCDVIDVLLIKVATLLPNLVKIGRKNERTAAVFLNSRWRQRHVEFRLQGVSLYVGVLFIKVATFLPNLVRIGKKMIQRHQFFRNS